MHIYDEMAGPTFERRYTDLRELTETLQLTTSFALCAPGQDKKRWPTEVIARQVQAKYKKELSNDELCTKVEWGALEMIVSPWLMFCWRCNEDSLEMLQWIFLL